MFTGVVDWVTKSLLSEEVRELRLEGYPSIYVSPLEAPNLPEVYQTEHKYEFTGFLLGYVRHNDFSDWGFTTIRVYAFEIRHLGEAD